MIHEGDALDVGTLRPHFSLGPGASQTDDRPAQVDRESAEQEITRLTWTVLDGSASLADRQRLAQLVNAQHAVRRRIDR